MPHLGLLRHTHIGKRAFKLLVERAKLLLRLGTSRIKRDVMVAGCVIFSSLACQHAFERAFPKRGLLR